ncbi:M48 family metalloprotease [Actinocrinis puniceicyclus]|uniref:M48 family metalloprotease n=1 Tax=Actinocrinis puniceicyclus TaxID=977794 RepID=A0A8J7WXY1_9ACTN|nr:M48 family metalloprotease [Actinocrinis puniceicyclus]MBS2967144.1 M48 family metalloprotease [Actinocrinis puniceicyclus]
MLIAIQLPGLLISAAVVWELAALGGTRFAIEVLLGWLLSGLLVFVRSVEELVAARYMRLRRPDTYEQYLLAAAWERVCREAGVRPDRFTFWIEESNQANAFASGGHIVAVTRRALMRMDPGQTEAVLAHELGHHLKGHAWVSLLFFWYILPGRVASQVLLFVLSRSVAFAARVPYLEGYSKAHFR